MSAIEANAEVFVKTFKSLKPRPGEAVLQRMPAAGEFSANIADMLALKAHRHQSRQFIREALKNPDKQLDPRERRWN